MSEQYRPDARLISIQQRVGFQKSTLLRSLCKLSRRRGNTSERCPVFQNSRVPFERGKDFSEDRPNTRSSPPNVNPIKIELHCFWKDIAENRPEEANFRPDEANFRPDARQPESKSQ
jgi:hypothetical protein